MRGAFDGFLLDEFEPGYLSLWRAGELPGRASRAIEALADCRCCPHACGAHRLEGSTGICETPRAAWVSSAFPHHGEEDCLRGTRGSGTIFFSQCNLRCVFCQNADISQAEAGRALAADELAALMLELQAVGCHNVNLVTPSHVVPQIVEALALAVPAGLRVPVVYNTSGYDALESLRLLEGLVDIYMPDLKLWSASSAGELCHAEDYPERAREALLEMQRQVGPLRVGPDGLARRGVLVRHLVMPGLVAESAALFEWLARELSTDTYLNLMGQYRPAHEVGRPRADGSRAHESIDRRPTRGELTEAFGAARAAGLWRFD